jgi:hypothetical protein
MKSWAVLRLLFAIFSELSLKAIHEKIQKYEVLLALEDILGDNYLPTYSILSDISSEQFLAIFRAQKHLMLNHNVH